MVVRKVTSEVLSVRKVTSEVLSVRKVDRVYAVCR